MVKRDLIELKQEIIKELEREIKDRSRLRKIKRDAHTKRIPIACGITVHMGFHCPFNCVYFYIEEMGFKFKETEPYPLSGKELALALLYNPSFVPGRNGTFIALGSIVDPFYPTVKEKTFEFIKTISTFLGNPIQFSTKMYLDEESVSRLREVVGKNPLSPLITIITINKAKQIEPKAISPELRFRTIENLRDFGFKPFVFIRPIIPGITDEEIDSILTSSKEYGAEGIVAGSLRVNKRILSRLEEAGVEVHKIKNRIKGTLGDHQIVIEETDLKKQVVQTALRLGLLAYNSACCANAYVANVPCYNLCFFTNRCVRCPNDCISKLPTVDITDVEYCLKAAFNVKNFSVSYNKKTIRITLKEKLNQVKRKQVSTFIKTIFRRFVKVRVSKY